MFLMFALTARPAWATPPALDLNMVNSVPGGTADITITLTQNFNSVAATSNDIGFDSSVLSITPDTDCLLNPATAPGFSGAFSKVCSNGAGFCTGNSDCTGDNTPPCNVVRLGVFKIPTAVIPLDGVLVTCTFSVSPTAPAGTYTLTNTPDSSDPDSHPIATTGSPGAINVAAAPPTATQTPGSTPMQTPVNTSSTTLTPTPSTIPTGIPTPTAVSTSTATTAPTPSQTPSSTPTQTRVNTSTPTTTPTPTPAQCVGDCDGSGEVTVDELIELVNIDLGAANASTCPHGIPSGASIDITLIIQAVGDALNNCRDS